MRHRRFWWATGLTIVGSVALNYWLSPRPVLFGCILLYALFRRIEWGDLIPLGLGTVAALIIWPVSPFVAVTAFVLVQFLREFNGTAGRPPLPPDRFQEGRKTAERILDDLAAS